MSERQDHVEEAKKGSDRLCGDSARDKEKIEQNYLDGRFNICE